MASQRPAPPQRGVSLSRDEFNRATSMFDDMDRNHDGVVDIAEFQAVMEVIGARSGREYSFENVRRMFMEADLNGDGVIDYDEWMHMQKKQKAKKLGMRPPTPQQTDDEDAAPEGSSVLAPLSETRGGGGITSTEELRVMLVELSAADDLELARKAEAMLFVLYEDDAAETEGSAALATSDAEAGLLSEERGGEDADGSVAVRAAAAGAASAGAALAALDRVSNVSVEMGPIVDSIVVDDDADDEGEGEAASTSAAEAGQRRPSAVGRLAQSTGSTFGEIAGSLAALVLPIEILISQGQNTGLTNAIFLSFAEEWDSEGEWPTMAIEYARYLAWMDSLNIDLTGLDRLVSYLPAGSRIATSFEIISDVPFVTLYLWCVVLVPLALSLFIILWQKPFLAVAWVTLLMLGLMLVVASTVGQLLIDPARLELLNLRIKRDSFQAFQVAGITLIACFLLRAVVTSYWTLRIELMKAKFKIRLAAERAKRKDIKKLQESLLGHLTDASAPRSPLVVMRSAALTLVFLLLSLAADFEAEVYKHDSNVESNEQLFGSTYITILFTHEVRLLCYVLAIGFGTHFILCLSRLGRKAIREIKYWINRFFLGFVLLLLSLLYTPITKQMLSVYLCIDQNCPEGEWYPKSAHQWLDSFLSDATIRSNDRHDRGRCNPCKFIQYSPGDLDAWRSLNDSSLAASTNLTTTFGGSCPAFAGACVGESLRVVHQTARTSRTMLCDESHGFYAWSSSLMVVGFTMAVPYLFYSLISHHTKILKQIPIDEARLEQAASDEPSSWACRLLCCRSHTGKSVAQLAWEYRAFKTRNRAKMLYEHFEWDHRYFRLVLLIHRLVLVCVALYMHNAPIVAAVLSILLHGLFFAVCATQQPYLNPAADALSSAASFANMCNPLFLLLAWYGVADGLSSSTCSLIIIGVNFGIPLFCLIVGTYLALMRRGRLLDLAKQMEGDLGLEELERITRQRKRNDIELEKDTTRTIATTFMLMCCTAFMACSLILISYIYTAAQGAVVQATPTTLGATYVNVQNRPRCEMAKVLADVEFLYTGSWEHFSAGCCCRDAATAPYQHTNTSAEQLYGLRAGEALLPPLGMGEVELWTCPDLSPENRSTASYGILHKLRSRRASDGESGLHLRPFCSPTFAPGIMPPAYDDDAIAYVVRYANGSLASAGLW